MLTRLGVALVREEDFCSRLSKGTTPLVHFYGHCQFLGKAAIGSYATRICGALSRKQRKCVPEFVAWVYAFMKRSRSAAAKEFLGDRSNSAAATRRSLGHPVVYAGLKYPSVRAAAAATGLHRNTITAHVNVRKRPACSGATPAPAPRVPGFQCAPQARRYNGSGTKSIYSLVVHCTTLRSWCFKLFRRVLSRYQACHEHI